MGGFFGFWFDRGEKGGERGEGRGERGEWRGGKGYLL